jgi:hypothetical protein
MSIVEKKEQINALMTEYSQLKGEVASRARCMAIKNQVANIMFSTSGGVFKYLCKIAKNKSEGYPTRYQPDEFVTETFLKYFDEYNSDRNDNFMKYFIFFLRCTVSNMIKREHPEHYPPMPIGIDDEGNEVDPFESISNGAAGPSAIVGLGMPPDETISEEEAAIRWKFKKRCSAIIVCVIRSKEHRGKRNEYYRAFATDFYISSCREGVHARYDMNENEAFHIMDLDFADWVLTAVCRSFSDFEKTPCKTYAEIGVTGRAYAIGEIETPFKNGVYAVRFKVDESAVSQQRGYFHEDIGVLVNEER